MKPAIWFICCSCTCWFHLLAAQNNLPKAFEIISDTIKTSVIPDSCWQYVKDNSLRWTIDSVQQMPAVRKFQNASDKLQRKDYPMHSFWIRYRLKNKMDRAAKIFLRFLVATECQIYLVQQDGSYKKYVNGYTIPWSKRDGIKSTNRSAPYLPIAIDSHQEVIVYTKTLAWGGYKKANLSINLYSQEQVSANLLIESEINYFDILANSFFWGAILLAFLFNTIFYFLAKDKIYLYFSLYVFALGINRFSDGLYHLFFRENPQVFAYIFPFIIVFIYMFFTLFLQCLLKIPTLYPRWSRFLYWLAFLGLIYFFVIIDVIIPVFPSIWDPFLVSLHAAIAILLWVSLLATLSFYIRTPDRSIQTLVRFLFPAFSAWVILWSLNNVPGHLYRLFDVPLSAFAIKLFTVWPKIEMVCLLWIIISFSWFLLSKFSDLQRQIVQKELEKEIERSQLIEQQNVQLEEQVTQRTEELLVKNRELEIETALERVRVLMMQMQRSTELPETTAKIFDELKGLNLLPADAALMLSLIDPEKAVSKHWATVEEIQGEAEEHQIPMYEHPLLIQTLEAWKRQEPVLIRDLSGTELHEFLRYLLNLPALRNSDLVKNRWTPLPERLIWTETTFSQGLLSVLSSVPLAEESIAVQARFAKVFELTYRRFLELQKAETQTREAQIEAALEAVRSRTMAMHKSEELQDVVNSIFEQFIALKIEVSTANILVFSETSQDIKCWTSNYNNRSFHIPFANVPVLKDLHQAKQNGQKLLSKSYTLEEKNQLFEYFFEKTDFRTVPDDRQKQILFADKYALSSAFSGNVAVQLTNYSRDSFSDDENKVLLRFAEAFFQAYTRFLDLQTAEKQAREAIIDAALERVRAEIASMRTSNDLQRITPLIWKELTTLQVPFIRCGVFIMDETREKVLTYLSTPEGQAIASFELPFDGEGLTPQVVAHWRKQSIFTDQWDEAQFQSWSQSLVQQGLVSSSEAYQTNKPPSQLCLHFIPFLQGMLYVGNTVVLTQGEIQDVQALANAFSTAYARYQDFSQLEIAKQQVENTLQELRSTQTQLIQSEKLASLGELTAGIAHEIQNPLNFVNNFAEVSAEMLDEMHEELEKGDTTEAIAIATDLKTNLEKINHHGQRASSIVKGMLEHSRASTGVKEPTDLNALADEYLRLAYHGLRAKDSSFNATMETHFDPDLPLVSVIPQDIGRVLLNLINNAFYAVTERSRSTVQQRASIGVTSSHADTKYQPTVTVSTQKTGDQVVIKVQDNGNGVPEAIKDKIFQPFFTTKPTGQGTGLGLSLAYDIVTKGHGGTLNVDSIEGEGSKFTISLPILT